MKTKKKNTPGARDVYHLEAWCSCPCAITATATAVPVLGGMHQSEVVAVVAVSFVVVFMGLEPLIGNAGGMRHLCN